jgi:serine/threonine-protein kinase
VVHRDLKPENVLLSGGHAVVADFGIAKALAAATQHATADAPALTATGVSLGTPGYMAPEQAVGDRNTDHRADLYALGVIAYEVLVGAHPFGSRTAQGLVAAHLTETPAPVGGHRPDVPPALAALVAALLAKEPVARPQGAEVVQALDAIVASPAPAAPRRRRTAPAVAAALLIVASAVAYALLREPATPGHTAIRTVAVLPFVNIGGNATDEYFSDGHRRAAHALVRCRACGSPGASSYAFKGRRCRRRSGARSTWARWSARCGERETVACDNQPVGAPTARCCGTPCTRASRATSSACRISSRAPSWRRSRRRWGVDPPPRPWSTWGGARRTSKRTSSTSKGGITG